ncbi:MAG: ATP-binding protein [Gammaproteobacteria bacterium]|nr:ATP-binding protein [Gammaproteobacteria bacterium]
MLKPLSIRQRLLTGVFGSFIFIWLILAILDYNSSSHEIEEVYDASLASYARIIASLIYHEAEEERELEENFALLIKELGNDILLKSSVLSGIKKELETTMKDDYMTLNVTSDIKGHNYETQIAFIIKRASGEVLLRSRDIPFQTEFKNGFFNIEVQEQSWRIFGLDLPKIGLKILVGENLEVRNELQELLISNHLWTFILLLPILGIVIWIAIKQGLLPLERVTQNIANRTPRSLLAIELDDIPKEISPLIDELNSLFSRIENALDNEKRFTANAAHELRTPLAALKVHAQVIELNANEKNRVYVKQMIESIDRSSHLVDQLLTLSKTEANLNKGINLQLVDLVSIVRTQLGELASTAIEKGINPTFEVDQEPSLIKGDETLLHAVIRNLIDNAIRYSDTDGQLEVVIQHSKDKVQLSIKDDGPGIEENKLELMTQRFQRGDHPDKQGSGLGLFIVKQIMTIFNGKLKFFNKSPNGLIVILEFTQCK